MDDCKGNTDEEERRIRRDFDKLVALGTGGGGGGGGGDGVIGAVGFVEVEFEDELELDATF